MAVFAHGQMRLYLLALLNEGPRHGYEIIQSLEERFNGLYSPSAGTVYPRLAKLEEEGLVERTEDGRKGTYTITDAGRREVAAREFDLADLQQDLDHSVRELAQEVRQRVHGSSANLREELKAAAKQARATATPAAHVIRTAVAPFLRQAGQWLNHRTRHRCSDQRVPLRGTGCGTSHQC